MKSLRAMSAAALLLAGVAASTAAAAVELKNSSNAKGGYFDPHTHWQGILPYRAYALLTDGGQKIVDDFLKTDDGKALMKSLGAPDAKAAQPMIEEYLWHYRIQRTAPGGRSLLDLGPDQMRDRNAVKAANEVGAALKRLETPLLENLAARMKANQSLVLPNKTAKLKDDDAKRVFTGSGLVYQLIDCAANSKNPLQVNAYLRHSLTSTPMNDYDTAYVARGYATPHEKQLVESVDPTLRYLRYQDITYSEQSVPFKHLLEPVIKQGVHTQGLYRTFEKKLTAFETSKGVAVRWLPMVLASALSTDGKSKNMWAQNPTTGACEDTKQPAPSFDEKGFLEAMSAPLVVGFDMASPERGCYNQGGATKVIADIFNATNQVAAKRGHLVAHVHVGEGYPVFKQGAKFDSKACSLKEEAVPVLFVKNEPAHTVNGRKNLEGVLSAIEKYLERPPAGFTDRIRIRLGHVTHATDAQIERMRAINAKFKDLLWVDVNLTSNMATGALTTTTSPGWHDEKFASPLRVGFLRRLATNRQNADLFTGHAFLPLLEKGVPVVLGTDGAGIEHAFMPREYDLARVIIAEAKGEGEGLAKNATPKTNELMKQLFAWQAAHYNWIKDTR